MCFVSRVSDANLGWPVPRSPSAEHLKNGGPTPSLPQTGTSVSLSSEPSPALRDKDLAHGVDVSLFPLVQSVE